LLFHAHHYSLLGKQNQIAILPFSKPVHTFRPATSFVSQDRPFEFGHSDGRAGRPGPDCFHGPVLLRLPVWCRRAAFNFFESNSDLAGTSGLAEDRELSLAFKFVTVVTSNFSKFELENRFCWPRPVGCS
jgi:hypothetical protein